MPEPHPTYAQRYLAIAKRLLPADLHNKIHEAAMPSSGGLVAAQNRSQSTDGIDEGAVDSSLLPMELQPKDDSLDAMNAPNPSSGEDDVMPTIVSLIVPNGVAQDLTNDTEAGQIAVPIAHMGNLGPAQRKAVHAAVQRVAQRTPPFESVYAPPPGIIAKDGLLPAPTGQFSPTATPPDLFASVNHPALVSMYEEMQQALTEVGMMGQPNGQGWMAPQTYNAPSGVADSGVSDSDSPWNEIPLENRQVKALAVHEGPNVSKYPLTAGTSLAQTTGGQDTSPPMTKADDQGGICVVIPVPPGLAKELALGQGQAPVDMHITLAYVPIASPEQLTKVVEQLKECCEQTSPIVLKITGVGRFHPTQKAVGMDPGEDLVYASVDSPGLPDLRSDVFKTLQMAGVAPAAEHGFTPHITLGTVAHGTAGTPWDGIPLATWTATALELWDDTDRIQIPLGGKPLGKQEVFWKAEGFATAMESPTEHRLVTGVVLAADLRDSQGDRVAPEAIEAAAHEFLKSYRVVGTDHSGFIDGSVPVESFIAPQELQINGKRVLKGSWVSTVETTPETWERVKRGELNSFSIEGWGTRHEEDDNALAA